MYSWLWSKLPGTKMLKLAQLFAIAAAVLLVLFGAVFPWLDGVFAQDPTLG